MTTNGWLDNLPDLWPGHPKEVGRGRNTSAKFYFPKFVDYPAVRRKLFDTLKNDGKRREWREGSMRASKESVGCGEGLVWEEHRYLYLWTPNNSRLAKDSDLLCYILAIYHDQVCEFAPKVITDEIINLNLNMYRNLVKFVGWLDQAKLETLLEFAGEKGLLEPVSEPAKPAAGSSEDIVKIKLAQSHLRAYQSYKYAEETEAELKGATLSEIYQWLKDPENKSHKNHPYYDYNMPKFKTWERYVRKVQKACNKQRNQPRAGRYHGSSIVSTDEIKYQSSQKADIKRT